MIFISSKTKRAMWQSETLHGDIHGAAPMSRKKLIHSNQNVHSTLLRRTNRDKGDWVVIRSVPLKVRATKAPPRVGIVTAPHSSEWTPAHHHNFCGQSCPCCRARAGDVFGQCALCEELYTSNNPFVYNVPVGTSVQSLRSDKDEDGYPMHLVEYPRNNNMVHKGWIYEKNIQAQQNVFLSKRGVRNGSELDVLDRGVDENNIAMYRIRVVATGIEGWVYAKNIVDDEDTCAVCMDKIASRDLFTCTCSHQFHRRCIARWYASNPTCPVCRTPNACVGL